MSSLLKVVKVTLNRQTDTKIFRVQEMSWWQLSNLIICVGFINIDELYLEVLDSHVDLVIFEIPY